MDRMDRVEKAVQIIAEHQITFEKNQLALQQIVADLATETRRGFDRVAEQFAETDRRMAETDRRLKETNEHLRETERLMKESSKQVDERIQQLVIAIGEFIRRDTKTA